MIQINQVKIPVFQDSEAYLLKEICRQIHCNESEMIHKKILKRSMDARKKPDLFYVYQVCVKVKNEAEVLKKCRKNKNVTPYKKPVNLKDTITAVGGGEEVYIIGSGPAGLFAAYYTALCGYKPIVIERGSTVDVRKEKIEAFWKTGVSDTNTNVSFGEGGAGTFSDGKLNTGVKDKFGRIRFVLETFVECGANPEILYEAKPHIGTDILQEVIKNLREKIIALGGVFHFDTCFTGLRIEDSQITGVEVKGSEGSRFCPCDKCVLAIGHSARDTFQYLYETGIEMEVKAFAVGVRVEHLQEDMNKIQYGTDDKSLPSADYKCTGTGVDDRGVYSFCMCPGGFVVNASSEEHALVVNGMSNHGRDEVNANSAIVVTVTPSDFPNETPLGGVEYQRQLEKAAFLLGNGKIPVQRFEDFQKNIPSKAFGRVTPNTKGGTILSNVRSILPDYIGDSIVAGMEQFGKRLKGFDDADTLLEGVETRTSSPVRIVRDDTLQSKIQGVYPCGEGAGYAGGIMSAAVDGLKVAQKICEK